MLAHSGGFGVDGPNVGVRWTHDVPGTPLGGLAVADGAVAAATGGGEESERRTYVRDPVRYLPAGPVLCERGRNDI